MSRVFFITHPDVAIDPSVPVPDAVKLSLARQGEERDVKVRTIDRYRYLRLETIY